MTIQLRHLAKVSLPNDPSVKALILNMYSYTTKNGDVYSNYIYKDNVAYLPPNLEKLKKVASLLDREIADQRSKGSPLGEPFVLSEEFKFRSYQEEPANELIRKVKDEGSCTLSAATGAGKTIVMTYAYGNIGRKTLVLLDQSNLIQNWQDAAKLIWNRDIQIIKAGTSSFGDVCLATFQLLARSPDLLKRMRTEFGTLVADEAHTAGADSFRYVLSQLDNKHRIACSASYFRKHLNTDILNDFLAPVGVTMVNKNAVVPEVRWVDTKVKWVSNIPMDFGCYTLPALAINDERNALIFKIIQECAADKRVIAVVCITIAQAKMLNDLANAAGISSISYTGTASVKKDREVKESIESGKIQVIHIVKKLDKGADIPSLDAMVLARPNNSLRDSIQVVGRLTRVKEGKRTPILYDLRDDVENSLAWTFAKNRKRYYKQLGYKEAK